MRAAFRGLVFALLLLAARPMAAADDGAVTQQELLELKRQNQQLMEQLHKQQQLIDGLSDKVSALEAKQAPTNATPAPTIPTNEQAETLPPPPPTTSSSLHFGPLDISGEGGVGFFKSGPNGPQPHSTFRIDEARLFLEAPVWNDVYFYSEIDLATREDTSLEMELKVGELYLDFEDVSKLWGRDRMLNIRAGRFYIPFGEEYLHRYAIDNPLISHSVSDIWGTDDGIEAYGKIGPVRYVTAVQNGGGPANQALQGDKSVTGRIGGNPTPWLYLSASAMRTGNLNVNNGISAIWFGNGWFRSVGPKTVTTSFHANLVEGDVEMQTPIALIKAAGGYVNYDDNDTLMNNRRDVYYYYVEGVHDWTKNLYSAVRWSQVLAHNGFPIVGNGQMGEYEFGPLTENYWRLSLGLGYRFSRNLLVKGEYSLNQGVLPDGTFRSGENQLSFEAAFKF